MSLANKRNCFDGLKFMELLHAGQKKFQIAFFDPQYRGVLDYLEYGNEGESRMVERGELQAMSEPTIKLFVEKIAELLTPSGYLFFWMDKFHLVNGHIQEWLPDGMQTVDLIVWNKELMAMGSRARYTSEYLVVCQKKPIIAKNWTNKSIRDNWPEKLPQPRTKGLHPHRKPIGLMTALVQATSQPDDNVLDPCAGSFSVLDVCARTKRNFWGCDIDPQFCEE